MVGWPTCGPPLLGNIRHIVSSCSLVGALRSQPGAHHVSCDLSFFNWTCGFLTLVKLRYDAVVGMLGVGASFALGEQFGVVFGRLGSRYHRVDRKIVVKELQCARFANLVRPLRARLNRLLASERCQHRLLMCLSLLHLLEQGKVLSLELSIGFLTGGRF